MGAAPLEGGAAWNSVLTYTVLPVPYQSGSAVPVHVLFQRGLDQVPMDILSDTLCVAFELLLPVRFEEAAEK